MMLRVIEPGISELKVQTTNDSTPGAIIICIDGRAFGE